MSERYEVWQAIEKVENELIRVRDVLAFAWQFAMGRGHDDADAYSSALGEVDMALHKLGFVRELLQNHAAQVNMNAVEPDAGLTAYEKWLEGDGGK